MAVLFADFYICLCRTGVLFLGFHFLSGSSECDDYVLPLFLACSAGVFTGNSCQCWRLGYFNELGEGRFEEKFFAIHWGSGYRGKGDHSRFHVTEQEMKLAKTPECDFHCLVTPTSVSSALEIYNKLLSQLSAIEYRRLTQMKAEMLDCYFAFRYFPFPDQEQAPFSETSFLFKHIF